MSEYRLLPAGDTALVVEFGDRIDRQLSGQVLALARRLDEARIEGVVESVPTFRSLMIHYDPLVLPGAALAARLARLLEDLRSHDSAGRLWRLPVCYDASLAPDLDEVAARTGLSATQVIERHSAATYHVYMLGFLPGQAYMGDVAPELALPRRESPRQKIPAGSLAIATAMTCIFPMETPCGWHLIGRSPIALWMMGPVPGALLAPGDKVGFAPVSLREYDDLSARIADGSYRIAPSQQALGAAA
jgi:inhibitor of KinA